MNTDRVDVATLPEIKISIDTMEILPSFSGGNPTDTRIGLTWKREVNQGTRESAMVVCRWKSVDGGVRVEMLRPVVTGRAVLTGDGYSRGKKRR